MSSKQTDRVIELEPREFSILKLIEECAELQEVAIKLITKPTGALEGKRLEHLIEELGDVNLRVTIVAKHLGLINEVAIRRQLKLEQTLEACEIRYGS
jgi:NTP pyrophosphatase (non-canonical NTP hydrolase)